MKFLLENKKTSKIFIPKGQHIWNIDAKQINVYQLTICLQTYDIDGKAYLECLEYQVKHLLKR